MWGLNDILTHSIAYGIGEEEEKAKAEREKKASNNWHTCTPAEEGWYLIRISFPNCRDTYTTYYHNNAINHIRGMVAWQKIEED